jgi:hypothetical protein
MNGRRKIMKKFVSGIVCLTMLFGLAITAGASKVEVELASTSYEITEDEVYASVDVLVSKVLPEEQVTFIAYDIRKPDPDVDNEPSSDNIIYIDQKAYEGSSVSTFSFKRNINDINSNVIIKSGAAGKEVSEPVKIAQHKASADVDVDNGSVVLGFWEGETFVELPKGDIPVLDESEVFYKITPKSGYTFKEILVNDENMVSRLIPQNGSVYVNVKDSSGNIVNVFATFEQIPKVNKIAKPVSYDEDGVQTGQEGEKVVKVATAVSAFKAKQDANIKEYGILYSKNPTELNQVTADNYKQVKKVGDTRWQDEDVIKFPALYKGADNRFAVQIIDDREEGNLLTGGFYVRSYVEFGDGEVIISNYVKISDAQQ